MPHSAIRPEPGVQTAGVDQQVSRERDLHRSRGQQPVRGDSCGQESQHADQAGAEHRKS